MLAAEIVLWAYIFPTYTHWVDVQSNADNQCYILEYNIPTVDPTLHPTPFPTQSTLSPTAYPTETPSMSPTVVSGTENFYRIDDRRAFHFYFS